MPNHQTPVTLRQIPPETEYCRLSVLLLSKWSKDSINTLASKKKLSLKKNYDSFHVSFIEKRGEPFSCLSLIYICYFWTKHFAFNQV